MTAAAAPPPVSAGYAAARRTVGVALEELRDLAHGIYPAALSDGGLRAGFQTLAETSPVPLIIKDPGPRRQPAARSFVTRWPNSRPFCPSSDAGPASLAGPATSQWRRRRAYQMAALARMSAAPRKIARFEARNHGRSRVTRMRSSRIRRAGPIACMPMSSA